jgi:hypothetical protein
MRAILLLTMAVAPVFTGCTGDRLTLAGYTLGSRFDPDVKTVYVPVFKMMAPATTPYRTLDQDMTRALIKELNSRPGLRVVSDPDKADTELVGTIISVDKTIYNRNQQNLWRDGDINISVQIVWRDLRSGRVLTNPGKAPGQPDSTNPFDPSRPMPAVPIPSDSPVPRTVTASGRVVPELGESTTTGSQMAVDKLARQIVNMMEAPW